MLHAAYASMFKLHDDKVTQQNLLEQYARTVEVCE